MIVKMEKEMLVDQILGHVDGDADANKSSSAEDEVDIAVGKGRKADFDGGSAVDGQPKGEWAQTLRLDPPEVVEVINESTKGFIRAAFPTIFQMGNAARQKEMSAYLLKTTVCICK